jgi:hypothetical protein
MIDEWRGVDPCFGESHGKSFGVLKVLEVTTELDRGDLI